jgi:Ser/Thr protein kinase RdoA (MazF antagonist)
VASSDALDLGSLDRRGRLRRTRATALEALARYDIGVARFGVFKTGWNTFYRIDARDGERFVLRIGAPLWRSLIDVRSELAWIEALRRETDLRVVEPIPARNGDLVTVVEAPGESEPSHCVVFRRLPGRKLNRLPAARRAYQLGGMAARLHDHAGTFRAPDPFTRRQHDSVWEYGPPDAIYSDEPHELLPPERRQVFRETAERVQAELDGLFADPAGKRFLHMDLHFRNVMLAGGDLAVLDFDDSEWGYPVQDIAISLHFMLSLPSYRELRPAYLRGYADQRPVPEFHPGQIDTLMAERQFNLIEMALSGRFPHATGWLPGILDTAERLLRRWLESGSLD